MFIALDELYLELLKRWFSLNRDQPRGGIKPPNRATPSLLMNKLTFAAAFCLLLAACQPASVSKIDLPTARVQVITPEPAPTLHPQATIIPSPTPTRDILYPYTIAGLRERDYPAGEIRVGAVIATTSAYTRYPIAYTSDGLTITGIMQIPAGEGPFPVIILNHGYYNRAEYRSGDGTERVAEILNQNGYLTLASDYRGWGGSDDGDSLFHTGLVVDVMHLLNCIAQLCAIHQTKHPQNARGTAQAGQAHPSCQSQHSHPSPHSKAARRCQTRS